MYYQPKYFSAKELLPESVYQKWGERGLAFLDRDLLEDLDTIREAVGLPITINGGGYKWSGFRTPEYSGYSPTSGHSLGRAFDLKLSGWISHDFRNGTVQYVMDVIKKLKQEGKLKAVRRMELGTANWVHIDSLTFEPNDPSGLYLFRA